MNRKYYFPDVEYGSPEYYRLYRLANIEKARERARAYDRRRRLTHPEQERARRKRWHEKYPEKAKAHRAVRTALEGGKLVQQPCEVCHGAKTIAHHDDYSKPLAVIWLCEVHHKARHKELSAFGA